MDCGLCAEIFARMQPSSLLSTPSRQSSSLSTSIDCLSNFGHCQLVPLRTMPLCSASAFSSAPTRI